MKDKEAEREIRRNKAFVRFIIFVAAVAFLSLLFFNFVYTKKCQDQGCFESALSSCKKVSFLKDSEEATWNYEIKGGIEGNFLCRFNLGGCKQCSIAVQFLQVKKGDKELKVLEGKKMECILPINSIQAPERDISKCQGSLKEEMQALIIKRLHNYIVNNVGKIGEELTKPF